MVMQTHLQNLLLKAVRNDLQLDNSAKRPHCCFSMETLDTFTLLTIYIYANSNRKETYCYVSMATTIT
jgi:hypothetical protein